MDGTTEEHAEHKGETGSADMKGMQDRRSEVRMLCADMVDVWWQDGQRERQATALLEDISRSGACLQFDHPLPLGTAVRLQFAAQMLEGRVVYCVFRDIGFFVGLEFTGAKWSPEEYEPQHLLDLQRLVLDNSPKPKR